MRLVDAAVPRLPVFFFGCPCPIALRMDLREGKKESERTNERTRREMNAAVEIYVLFVLSMSESINQTYISSCRSVGDCTTESSHTFVCPMLNFSPLSNLVLARGNSRVTRPNSGYSTRRLLEQIHRGTSHRSSSRED